LFNNLNYIKMKSLKIKNEVKSIDIIKLPELLGSDDLESIRGGVSLDDCTCNNGSSLCKPNCFCNDFSLICTLNLW